MNQPRDEELESFIADRGWPVKDLDKPLGSEPDDVLPGDHSKAIE